jgi:hypothetical protein
MTALTQCGRLQQGARYHRYPGWLDNSALDRSCPSQSGTFVETRLARRLTAVQLGQTTPWPRSSERPVLQTEMLNQQTCIPCSEGPQNQVPQVRRMEGNK